MQWFSKGNPWSSSIQLTWDLIRNAYSWPHPRPMNQVLWGKGWSQQPVLQQSLQGDSVAPPGFENRWHREVMRWWILKIPPNQLAGLFVCLFVLLNEWTNIWGAKCFRIVALDLLGHSDLKDNRAISTFKKEGNPDICDNKGEPGGPYVKRNKPEAEREILYGLTYIWNTSFLEKSNS